MVRSSCTVNDSCKSPKVQSESIQVRDVTGDGRDEILILGDDTVECRDASGHRLWRLEGYPKPSVVDVRDYAGDGSRGHPPLDDARRSGRGLHGRRPHRAVDPALEGREQLRRAHPVRQAAARRRRGAGRQHLQRANPAGTARREASGSSASRTASIDPASASVSPCAGDFYSPLMLFDDLDADGAAEMVVISHEATLVLRHRDTAGRSSRRATRR